MSRLVRVLRANLLDEMSKPYVVTARAKGMRELSVVLKYPLRLALNPFVSTIGLMLPTLISGSIIVSMVLNIPTLGPLLLQALQGQDMFLASAILLILSTLGRARDADIRSAAELDRPANQVGELGSTVAPQAENGNRMATPATAASQPVLSPRALFRKRFMRHRLAVVSAVIVALFYLVVAFADFLAYSDPTASNSQRALVPPQGIHFFDEGRFAPHVHGLQRSRNRDTYGLEYVPDGTQKIPLVLFAKGYEYKLFGLMPADRHLIGTQGAPAQTSLFLLGADAQGRDLFSRTVLAIRTSLLIGLAAVVVSITVGIVFGTISGFYGGLVDLFIQRLIEILRSIPDDSVMDGTGRRDTAYLGYHARLFHGDPPSSPWWAGPNWRESCAAGSCPCAARISFIAAELSGAGPARIMFVHLLPPDDEPHHRDDDAGNPGDDRQRDGPGLFGARPAPTGHFAGRAAEHGAKPAKCRVVLVDADSGHSDRHCHYRVQLPWGTAFAMRQTQVASTAGNRGGDMDPIVQVRDLTVDFDTVEGRIRGGRRRQFRRAAPAHAPASSARAVAARA